MTPRLRLTFGGMLAQNSDWQNTIDLALGAPIQNLATLQNIVQSTFDTFSSTTGFTNGCCIDSNIRTVKGLYYAGGTGPVSLVAESTGTAVLGAATPIHAPQVCVVASLRTDQAGRSHRGRLYVPYRSIRIEATGLVEPQGQIVAANWANGMQNAAVAACASVGLASSWIVWSRTLGVGTPVSAVLVGNQCDTQRRRNRNRDEAYSSYPVTAAVVQAQSPGEQAMLEKVQSTELPLDWNLGVPDWANDLANVLLQVIPFVPPAAE